MSRNADSQISIAKDRGYDVAEFVQRVRGLGIPVHVVVKKKGSAIPGEIKEAEGCATSLRQRKIIEDAFGWVKEVSTLGRVMLRGVDRIRSEALLSFAAYNLLRMSSLLARSG